MVNVDYRAKLTICLAICLLKSANTLKDSVNEAIRLTKQKFIYTYFLLSFEWRSKFQLHFSNKILEQKIDKIVNHYEFLPTSKWH